MVQVKWWPTSETPQGIYNYYAVPRAEAEKREEVS